MNVLEHGQPPADDRNFRAVKQLVHEEMIAHQNGAFHGGCGYDRSFPDKDTYAQNNAGQNN